MFDRTNAASRYHYINLGDALNSLFVMYYGLQIERLTTGKPQNSISSLLILLLILRWCEYSDAEALAFYVPDDFIPYFFSL